MLCFRIHVFVVHVFSNRCLARQVFEGRAVKPLRIQVYPKKGITPNQSYAGDGIETINPILGRGLDS